MESKQTVVLPGHVVQRAFMSSHCPSIVELEHACGLKWTGGTDKTYNTDELMYEVIDQRKFQVAKLRYGF